MSDEKHESVDEHSPEPKKQEPSDGGAPAAPEPETALQKPAASEIELVQGQRSTDLVMSEPVGMLAKLRVANLRSRKELEAANIVLDAQLAKLRHQGEAVARESKAYWDAKSVEVASSIKTYVQARLRGLENERMASRMDSLQEAYELYAEKTKEVLEGPMPDSMKESLIKRLGTTLEDTLTRIETDAIASEHELGD